VYASPGLTTVLFAHKRNSRTRVCPKYGSLVGSLRVWCAQWHHPHRQPCDEGKAETHISILHRRYNFGPFFFHSYTLLFSACSCLVFSKATNKHYIICASTQTSSAMAPSLVEAEHFQGVESSLKDLKLKSSPKQIAAVKNYIPGQTIIENHSDYYEHEGLMPTFPAVHWDALEEVHYEDRGVHGDAQFRNLLSDATDIFDYNPKIGTEIHGVRLSQLTSAQKDDLARLIATRGVVFFRSQDDFDIEAQRELGQYFGSLHKHATTSVPKKGGLDDVHVVYTDENSKDQRAMFNPSFLWHSDVSARPCNKISFSSNGPRLTSDRSHTKSNHLPILH
jgi:Taurine catabolism dioxygenase TauD, TfdA family